MFLYNHNTRFATLDIASLNVNHVQAAAEGGAGRNKTRLNKESGAKIKVGVKIGGDFSVQKNPPFLKDRQAIFDTIKVIKPLS